MVMSDLNDPSEDENFYDNDSDFNEADYLDEIDSEDSFEGLTERNKNETSPRREEKNDAQENEDDEREKEYIGPILAGGHRFDKKFICIKYPGNVINPDKATETLGGLPAISTAVNTRNRRLELRFRPNDGYSKPACGDRHATAGFLLLVRVKKKGVKNENENLKEGSIKTDVIEVMNTDPACVDSDHDPIEKSSANIDNNLKICTKLVNSQCIIDSESNNTDKNKKLSSNGLVQKVQNSNVEPNDDSVKYFEKNVKSSKQDSVISVFKENVCTNTNSSTNANPNDHEMNVRNVKENIRPTFEKNKYEDLSQDNNYTLPKLKVLGRVDSEFRFTSLCDFQYLSITPKMTNPKENECIYDSLFPVNIPPYRWLENKVPFFLPPAAFSRMGNVQQYVPKTETDALPGNIIGKTRKRRNAGFPSFIHFLTPNVPTESPKGIETAMRVKFLQKVHLERVRKMFEQRPIWSKNALMYETKFMAEQLKILLPSVAYYFMTGPWRIMWVKLGYDPRKDPSARKYQTLDYRLKAMHGLESTVKCKRSYSNYMLPYKSAPISKPKTTVLTSNLNSKQSLKKERHLKENIYIYREGVVPPSRQMFYQYCDILADEVQEMLAKLPDPPPGTKCHEKMGWLPNGFDDQCREIINKQVRVVLRKQMNIPEDHPTTLPRKRKFGPKLKLKKVKSKQPKKSQLLNLSSTSIHMQVVPEESDEEWENDAN